MYYFSFKKIVLEEFVKSTDPSVHTQIVSCYRYNLESYLPLFLWATDCARRVVLQFWEHLDLLSKCNAEEFFGLNTEEMVRIFLIKFDIKIEF